ncbi:CPK1 [Symbiodinium pilosum]|uniref:CPK1 protein n=1 Tax=Symbiodinium pilosum TaxID=2952 RepID=A0A812L237_SYMPI|nr:CPK1 [Symbiodinium pilosum]
MVVRVTSADEVYIEVVRVEKEFQAALDLWKKDADAINEFFSERLGAGQLELSADAAAEAEKEKYEAEVKAAEEEEREAPPAPDPQDLVVLASGSSSWVDKAIFTVGEALEARRPIFNFLLAPGPATQEAPAADEAAAAEEEQVLKGAGAGGEQALARLRAEAAQGLPEGFGCFRADT